MPVSQDTVNKWNIVVVASLIPVITTIFLAGFDFYAEQSLGDDLVVVKMGFFRMCMSGIDVPSSSSTCTTLPNWPDVCTPPKILSWCGAFCMWFQCLFALFTAVKCWSMRASAKVRLESGLIEAPAPISLSPVSHLFRLQILLSVITFSLAMGLFYGSFCGKGSTSDAAGIKWGPTLYCQIGLCALYLVCIWFVQEQYRLELSETAPVVQVLVAAQPIIQQQQQYYPQQPGYGATGGSYAPYQQPPQQQQQYVPAQKV